MSSFLTVALTGSIGSGKSTVAEHLILRWGFQRVRFAHPLKEMISTLLRTQGCTDAYIKRCIEGDLKTKPVPELAGRTPRYVMQTLGTEWGRDTIHNELWSTAWMGAAEQALKKGHVVAEDCRFINEFDTVKAMGGLVWRISRDGFKGDGHVSETEQNTFDVDSNFLNDSTPRALLLKVDQTLRSYTKNKKMREAYAT
jgi:hypothetical protein